MILSRMVFKFEQKCHQIFNTFGGVVRPNIKCGVRPKCGVQTINYVVEKRKIYRVQNAFVIEIEHLMHAVQNAICSVANVQPCR